MSLIWSSACCGYLLAIAVGEDGPQQVCDRCKKPTRGVPIAIGDDPAAYPAFLARPIHREAARRAT